ncbi:hypothetical protein [Oceanobacillus sp. FSL W7-1309]
MEMVTGGRVAIGGFVYDDIPDVQVEWTMIDGDIVYRNSKVGVQA